MALIMSIVERGSGSKLIKLYSKNQVFTHLRCEGAGTATSEIMDILGLGSSEKDIVLSITTRPAAQLLLERLDDELRGATPGKGIAFAIPLTAVSSLIAAFIDLKTRTESEGGSGSMEKEQKSSMILVTVNQGFTDAVMDTARKAGARGGTIIRGRWAGDESFAQSYRRRRRSSLLWSPLRYETRLWTRLPASTACARRPARWSQPSVWSSWCTWDRSIDPTSHAGRRIPHALSTLVSSAPSSASCKLNFFLASLPAF